MALDVSPNADDELAGKLALLDGLPPRQRAALTPRWVLTFDADAPRWALASDM